MPEARARHHAIIAIAIGLILSLLAGSGGIAAAFAGWLAQPALALGVRGLRGGLPATRVELLRDAGALLACWGGALAGAALLVAWPLAALRASGALGAALALSGAIGVCLVALWRTWPLWHGVEHEGGGLARHWRALAEQDASSWRGFGAALCVGAVVAAVLALAWPGLLPGAARWWLAAVAVPVSPLLHVAVQRLRAPEMLAGLPVLEMPGPDGGQPGGGTIEVHGLEAALYAAARTGRVDRALELLDAGADPFALPPPDDRDQRSLAVLAAVLPDLRLLRALIARGVDLNTPHAGMTPLLAATRDSWHGRPEAVMTLLANGADPRATDGEGNTPLHHAARSSDPGVAALLLDAAAELGAINGEGFTPLGVACSVGNWRLARFLLERGAKTEVEGAVPALLAAAGSDEDDPAGVLLLLRHKAHVDSRDSERRSALHVAAACGHADIVAALIDAGADVHARDAQGMTPLLAAARGGRPAAFDVLLDASADPLAADDLGRTALVHAVQAEIPSLSLVQRILALGVDPARADATGKRAVDYAAEAGRWAMVSLLDPAYALPASVRPEEGGTAPDRPPLELLREGLLAGRHEELERLVPLLSPAELSGLLREPDVAASAGSVHWLLGHGADPALPDGAGTLPAFELFGLGADAVPALQALLEHGAPMAGEGGLARFLAACLGGDRAGDRLEEFALRLVDGGVDTRGLSPAGDPPLSLAIHLGWDRLAERLARDGAPLDARDARGMTALHLAAALGRMEAVKMLVRHGASPEERASDGQTALGVALACGRRDLADWLDWRGWRLPKRPLRDEDVPAAAIAGDADAVRRLLDLGFPVDAVDAQGCTALLRACGGGHRAVVELLLARGANPQHTAHTGATPLSAAVSMRHGEIVDRLLAAGAPLEQRLPNDVTVLMLAAALGHPDLCAKLLTAGANVHATDAQGLTPLHCAALYGFTARDRARLLALFDTLLLAGAEVDAQAAGGVTPLLLLLGARAEPGTACDEEVVLAAMEQLLDEGGSLEARDPRGFGPLHLASLHGLLQVTRRLLRAGADPDQRDALNRTPREIAVMRGFVDVAAEYAPPPQGVSMARFLRDRS